MRLLKIVVSPNIKYTQYHWKPIHLHKSKHTKFKQLKYNKRHNLINKQIINKHPKVNQYKSIYLADIKSQVQNKLFSLVINNIHIKKRVHIQIQTNKVKDNKTITESIKNNIQNEIK